MFSAEGKAADRIYFHKTADALHEYHRLMMSSRIQWYEYSQDPDLLPGIISGMEKARELFPEDLWNLYWLNFARTRSGEYDAALKGWETFLENRLSLCMSVLPKAYEMASECAFQLGMDSEGKTYEAESSRLSGM